MDRRKLTDYCLDPTHRVGAAKAQVFRSALGITVTRWRELESLLLQAANTGEARRAGTDNHGEKWVVESPLQGRRGPVVLVSVWLLDRPDGAPRLVSCYVDTTKE